MHVLQTHKTVGIKGLSLVFLLIVLACPACDSPDPTGPAATSRVTLTTTRTELPADGESTAVITAYVLNRNGNPAEGPIYWSTTCGTLDGATGTLVGGYADVVLTASNYPCTAVVTADAVHAQKSIELQIYGYGIDISADPNQIPADGASQSRILTYVYDQAGHPVEDGTTVSFSTTAGTLSSESVSTSGGWASCTLTSSTNMTTAVVRASVQSAVATTYVNFTSMEVGTITLTASPNSGIPADGANFSILQAMVRNLHSVPMENITVKFTSTRGTLEQYQVSTDGNGVASTRLIAPYSTTDTSAMITAAAGGKTGGPITVFFTGYSGTPQPSPTPQPTFTPTPTPTHTPADIPTNTPTRTPTETPVNTSTPTFTPNPSSPTP
jgi:hypothetical protein